jgi:hypothetical protein
MAKQKTSYRVPKGMVRISTYIPEPTLEKLWKSVGHLSSNGRRVTMSSALTAIIEEYHARLPGGKNVSKQ